MAQKDVGVKEVRVAVGLNRARIGLEEGLHLKFRSSYAVPVRARERVDKRSVRQSC